MGIRNAQTISFSPSCLGIITFSYSPSADTRGGSCHAKVCNPRKFALIETATSKIPIAELCTPGERKNGPVMYGPARCTLEVIECLCGWRDCSLEDCPMGS